MPLRDPPLGVWLEPWLIYDIDDLERETYRALLQLVGWMWVTKKTGGPLRTTVAELAQRWGIGERAVYSRLAAYRERGYIELEVRQGRVTVRLGSADTNKQTNKQTNSGEGRDHVDMWSDLPGERRDHSAGVDRRNISGSGSSSSNPDPELLHQTPINAAVQGKLTFLGVRPAAAMQLAADEWVTMERVLRWEAALRADESVRSVPAVLFTNLRDHWEPPLTESELRRQQYAELGVLT